LGEDDEVLECTVTYFHPKGFEIRAEVATEAAPAVSTAETAPLPAT
jgi:GntR family transcriptional regulator